MQQDLFLFAIMQYAAFFLLALACEILGTVAGFGSSVFFIPAAQFFFNIKLVLAITGLFHIFSNTTKLIMFYKHLNIRLSLLYGVPSLLFTIIGALLAVAAVDYYLDVVLGTFLFVFSILLLLNPNYQLPATTTNAISSGSVAGFLAGFMGTGGALRGLSLAAFQLEKNTFIATSAAIDFGVDFSRFIIYYRGGFWDNAFLSFVPLLLVASVLGTYAGKWLLNKISQIFFQRMVLVFIGIIGFYMLLKYML